MYYQELDTIQPSVTVNDRESRTSLDRRQTRDRARETSVDHRGVGQQYAGLGLRRNRGAISTGDGLCTNGARLELYTITEIPRSESVTSVIRARYHVLDEFRAHPPDALIMTGAEPKYGRLDHEPYWPELTRLMEWAAHSVPTTLLSCLAAHAFACCSTGLSAFGAM